jgi:hypothetical protein
MVGNTPLVVLVWILTVPLGIVLAVLGGLVYARVGRGEYEDLEILSWYFGILGGLLTLLFLGTLWYWMKCSRLETGAMKRASDLSVIGCGFITLAS